MLIVFDVEHWNMQVHKICTYLIKIYNTGCYLVRLYYVGAWRCVWVSDQVPIDANESPLLPFAPSFSQNSVKPEKGKQAPATATTPSVNLWPLLICKVSF